MRPTLVLLTSVLIMYSQTGLALASEDNDAKQKTIRIAVDEWPPYESKHSKHFGGLLRIITESFAQNNIIVEYGWMPWKRCLVVAERGIWDGAAVSQKSKEREAAFYFSDPIMTVNKVFFHLKSLEFDWDNYDDLADFIIGVPLGNYFGEEFQQAKAENKLDIEEVTTQFEQNFKKLLAGRIHLFPTEKEAGYNYLRQNHPSLADRITHHSLPIQSVAYHLILSRKNKKNVMMLDHFNNGFRQLKSEKKDILYLRDSLQGKYLLTPSVETSAPN